MSRRAFALPLAGVGAATLLAYAPALSASFQFDDYARLFDNPALPAGDWWTALLWLGGSRLLPSLTLAVTYVVQRSAVFAGLFSIWAVVCYLRARMQFPSWDRGRIARSAARYAAGETPAVPARRLHAATRWYLGSLLLAVCAVLSKENAVCLPVLIVLIEVVAFGGRPWRRLLLRGALIVALLLVLPLGWKVATWRPMLPGPQPPSIGERLRGALFAAGDGAPAARPLTYALTQCVVVPRYFSLVALPWRLNVDHDVRLESALSPAVAGGALLLAALLAAGVAVARRAPLLGLGVLWVFAALAVESSLLPIPDVMMEHRMDLAMPGVALLAAQAVASGRARAPRTTAAAENLAIAREQLGQAPDLPCDPQPAQPVYEQ